MRCLVNERFLRENDGAEWKRWLFYPAVCFSEFLINPTWYISTEDINCNRTKRCKGNRAYIISKRNAWLVRFLKVIVTCMAKASPSFFPDCIIVCIIGPMSWSASYDRPQTPWWWWCDEFCLPLVIIENHLYVVVVMSYTLFSYKRKTSRQIDY